MYVIIEYSDYLKEQRIKVHGYTDIETNACVIAQQLCKNNSPKIDDTNFIEYVKKINNEDTSYIRLENENIIAQYRNHSLRLFNDDDIKCIFNSFLNLNERLNATITIKNFINEFEIYHYHKEFGEIIKNFNINDVLGEINYYSNSIDINFTKTKYLINFMLINNYGIDIGADRSHFYSSYIYAVILCNML